MCIKHLGTVSGRQSVKYMMAIPVFIYYTESQIHRNKKTSPIPNQAGVHLTALTG